MIEFKRRLRMKDIEAWEFLNPDNPIYLIISDMRRPSVLDDYPYLIGIENPNDFGRENYIKVLAVSKVKIDEKTMDEVTHTMDHLIAHVDQGYCDWNVEEIIGESNDIEVLFQKILTECVGKQYNLNSVNKYLQQE